MTNPKVTIYTDGGCEPNPGVGGFAALLLFENGQKNEISGGETESTNNRMELTAAIMALELLTESHEIEFYTDSEYLRKGITEWIKNWIAKNWQGVANVDLWKRLYPATKKHIIRWHWVKGHAGNEHNEYVDQLAMREIEKLGGFAAQASKVDFSLPEDKRLFIYGKGVFSNGYGGWATIIIDRENEKVISGGEPPKTSANRMELLAAIHALESIEQPREIEYITDSRYLQQGITDWVVGWAKNNWITKTEKTPVANKELWQHLATLKNNHTIKWIWQRSENDLQKRVCQLAEAAVKGVRHKNNWG